ncbi:MAG: hypothetical protein V4622_11245 [Bacteroidota bacterium]
MNKSHVFLIILVLFSCSQSPTKSVKFKVFLDEPCMILNQEQDNSIEGTYITVKEIQKDKSRFKIEFPKHFYLKNSNCKNWFFGWGTDKAYYDAGVENLRGIEKIDLKSGWIYYGEILRGKALPKINQRLVFWNKYPSGFKNQLKRPIINTKLWPEFSGESVAFSSVEYDSVLHKWIMLFHECDNNNVQIYAASSKDLNHWKAENSGKAILTAKDFRNCLWAGLDQTGKHKQTPFVSDIVRFQNNWFIFLNGYDKNGKRHIGYAISKNSLLGPYIISKKPIISPDKLDSWNDEAVFYAKVKKYKNEFIMFFDGRNAEGVESVGMAKSKNLTQWTIYKNNPVIVDHYSAWRSNLGSSEPNHIEIRNDSIFLMISGTKKFKEGFWHHYISGKMYKDVSGNVDDAQLGIYLSTDNGKSFLAHKNNPIFTNDYSNKYENEHMGGNFKLIKTDTSHFIIYQAKTNYKSTKYGIFIREKKLKKD